MGRLNISALDGYLEKRVTAGLRDRCGDAYTVRVHEISKDDDEYALVLAKNGVSLSTITMNLYHTHPDGFEIVIDSHTQISERRKKYNAFLRNVCLMLATKMRWKPGRGAPTLRAVTMTSYAVSAISVYSLMQLGFHIEHVLTKGGKRSVPVDDDQMGFDDILQKMPLHSQDLSKSKKQWSVVLLHLHNLQTDANTIRKQSRQRIRDILPHMIC